MTDALQCFGSLGIPSIYEDVAANLRHNSRMEPLLGPTAQPLQCFIEPGEGGHRWGMFAVTHPLDGPPMDPGSSGEGGDVPDSLEPSDDLVELLHASDSEASMPHSQGKNDADSNPQSAPVEPDAQKLVAEFLEREIGTKSVRAWAAEHGLKSEWVLRARSARHAITLQSLQLLADKLHVEPWQLLFPGFDPKRPPQLPKMSTEAVDAAKMLDSITDAQQRRAVYAVLMNAIELVRSRS